jgi:hypothetical protein
LLEEQGDNFRIYFIFYLSALNKFDNKKGIGGSDYYYLVMDAVCAAATALDYHLLMVMHVVNPESSILSLSCNMYYIYGVSYKTETSDR